MRNVIFKHMGLTIFFAASLSTAAYAAGQQQDTANYSYFAGQQENAGRHELYAAAGSFGTDEEREAWYAANDIGNNEYLSSQKLNAEALLKAVIIDSETAAAISAYASAKHDEIHDRYNADISSMSPDERSEFYVKYSNDSSWGDTVNELLGAGIISESQAAAISQYLE